MKTSFHRLLTNLSNPHKFVPPCLILENKALMCNCANKRKWYQPSYNMEYYQQETQAGRHVGIPHEKAEKHASFFIISSLNLWLSNEIRNAVWAKRVHWVIEKTCVRAFELRTPTFLSGSSFFREERWAIIIRSDWTFTWESSINNSNIKKLPLSKRNWKEGAFFLYQNVKRL